MFRPSSLFSLAGGSARPMSRDKADTLLLLATCILVLAPHASHLPGWVVLICCAILSWRAWVTFRGNRMPPRWLLVSIAFLAMLAVYWDYKTIFGRDAGVSMLVMLLTFKLLEMHAKRDLFVVLFLGFFLILSSFFYSQSIATALLTILAVVAILTTQLSFQYTGTVPPLTRRLRHGAFILALAAPITLVLFLLFPRIQGPLWGMPSDAGAGHSGMSDKMSPGNISNLALSEDIVFRAKFTAAPPPKPALYWRGPVLGAFDGRTWSPLQSGFNGRRRIDVGLRGEPLRYQVTLEPTGRNWLFPLEVPHAIPVLPGNVVSVGPDLEMRTASPINERIRFDTVSSIDFVLQPNENPIVLRQWLGLPPGFNPRAMAFAQSLRAESDNPRDLVNAVLTFFRTEKFSYTLQPPPLGRHSVDEFLFDTRAGFCEHYSSAFVVLMRAMDVPARVVTGYQGGEINPADGYMTVRQSDAHAWAEVWLPEQGWTRIDPTSAVAPDRIEMNLDSVIPRRMFGGLLSFDGKRVSWLAHIQSFRQNWDALTNSWNQWVLNYSTEQQKNFVKSFGFDDVDWRTLTLLMISVGSVITTIIVLPLILSRTHLDPVEAVYRRLCDRLARQGHVRLPHEGPRTYRQRITAPEAGLPPKQKEAVARFLDFYETARYGAAGGASSAAVLSQLKSLYAQCR